MRAAVARRDAVAAAFAPDAPDSEWDLLWRIAEGAAPRTIAHLPRVLIHRAHRPRGGGKAARPVHRHFERQGVAAGVRAVDTSHRGGCGCRCRRPHRA